MTQIHRRVAALACARLYGKTYDEIDSTEKRIPHAGATWDIHILFLKHTQTLGNSHQP